MKDRKKILKILDSTKHSIDAWTFKNLFFTFLFIRITKPKEYHEFIINKVKKLYAEPHHAQYVIDCFISRCDEDKVGLSEIASLSEIFRGVSPDVICDKLIHIMMEINSIDLSQENDFGDLYEYLIDEFGLRSGKSAGEFYTPSCVRELIFRLCTFTDNRIDHTIPVKPMKHPKQFILPTFYKVYDPTCGTGSLLLKFRGLTKNLYGQEINRKSYDFARLNMVANGVKDFHLALGDTLTEDKFENEKFDVIVANYPFGIKWDDKKADPDRFKFGIPPGSKADYAFIQHMLNKLAPGGICVSLCFPGILYREGREKNIRRNLIKAGHIMAVIDLPDGLFFGTSIGASILILSEKPGNDILFVDATKAFEKKPKMNVITEDTIILIRDLFLLGGEKRKIGKEGSIRWITKTIEEVLDPNGSDGLLSVANHIPVEEEETEINTEEMIRQQTLTTLRVLKCKYKCNRMAKQLFGDTCKEAEELDDILEKYVQPLWDKYLKD